MKFMNTYEWMISTLSPVHIGCAEDYTPTEYVVDNTVKLYCFYIGHLASLGDAAISKEVSSALTAGTGEEQLRKVHKVLNNYRDKIIPIAGTSAAMCSGVLNHYRSTQSRNHDFNRNGIERTSYQPLSQLPYLPGSSIKGAIRTALLDNASVSKAPLGKQFIERINRFNNMIEEVNHGSEKFALRLKLQFSRKDYLAELKNIEKELAGYADDLEKEHLGSFESDPLRAIKIGDGIANDTGIEKEIRFCLNRSRSGRKTQAQSKGLYTRLEYIVEHQPEAIKIAITIQDLSSVAGMKGKHNKLITPAPYCLKTWEQIIEACNAYYLPRLQKDLQLVLKLKPGSTWVKQIREIFSAGLLQDIENKRVLLLRVGKHGGADCNTVTGRKIKIKLSDDKRNLPTGKIEKIPLYCFDDEPRTTWFSGDDLDNPSDLLPHGWIVLSKNNLPWQSCMPGFQRREDRKADMCRQAEEAAARQAREQAKAEAAAAREQALVAMTPNQRQIEEFRDYCQKRAGELGKSQEALNAVIHTKARQLIKQALEEAAWTTEEKRALADVVSEWLPKLVRQMDKDQLKKLKLAALRGN